MIMSYFCGSELQIQHDPAWPSAWGAEVKVPAEL